jgi:hypothetical protein
MDFYASIQKKINSSDYHDEMNGDNFREWFESIIPRLESNSVIVMDNAPYHSVKSEKIPTSQSKKEEILTWLSSKGVQLDRPMIKPQAAPKSTSNKIAINNNNNNNKNNNNKDINIDFD